MNLLRTYWRWLALIAVVAVLTNSRNLPWPFVTLVLGATAGYLLPRRMACLAARRRTSNPQQSDLLARSADRSRHAAHSVPHCPDVRSIGPALIYLVPGLIFALVAVAIVLRSVGL
jgi:hypothetical protein